MAYTLAGIFGSHGCNQYMKAYVEGELEEKYPPLDNAIAQVLAEERTTLNLV
jgi:hypothetical protein